MDVREIRKMMMMRLGLLLLAEMLLVADRGPAIDGLVVKASAPRVLHLGQPLLQGPVLEQEPIQLARVVGVAAVKVLVKDFLGIVTADQLHLAAAVQLRVETVPAR